MSNLTEILANKETDKIENGIAQVYDDLWEEYRYGVRSMLEIGVDRAGSIQGWLEFFPDADIYGVDINSSGFAHPRYHEYVGDAKSYFPPEGITFDIVIDDGSHQGEDIRAAWNNLWPYVEFTGYYVVEDIQVPYNTPRMPHYFLDWAMANNTEMKIERYNLMWLRKGN